MPPSLPVAGKVGPPHRAPPGLVLQSPPPPPPIAAPRSTAHDGRSHAMRRRRKSRPRSHRRPAPPSLGPASSCRRAPSPASRAMTKLSRAASASAIVFLEQSQLAQRRRRAIGAQSSPRQSTIAAPTHKASSTTPPRVPTSAPSPRSATSRRKVLERPLSLNSRLALLAGGAEAPGICCCSLRRAPQATTAIRPITSLRRTRPSGSPRTSEPPLSAANDSSRNR